MAQYGPNLHGIHARLQKRLLRVLQVLAGILLIVVIVQKAHGLPVLHVLAEVLRHRAHGIGDVQRVYAQVFLGHHGVVELPGTLYGQHVAFLLIHE